MGLRSWIIFLRGIGLDASRPTRRPSKKEEAPGTSTLLIYDLLHHSVANNEGRQCLNITLTLSSSKQGSPFRGYGDDYHDLQSVACGVKSFLIGAHCTSKGVLHCLEPNVSAR